LAATLVFSLELFGNIPCWGAPHAGQASALGPISAPQHAQKAAIMHLLFLSQRMDDAATITDSMKAKIEGARAIQLSDVSQQL
jgi:hypothetical protein